MNVVRGKMRLALLLAVLSLVGTGCSVDRSDPKAVSEMALRAILAKNYDQLRQLVGCGAVIPDGQPWREASFIRDHTVGERIKESWIQGGIGGYVLNDVMMEDFQGNRFVPEKLVQVHFVLSGKEYIAIFPITLCDNKWSPGTNPSLGEFIVSFEERVE